jgi:hypothetical protein
MENRNAQRVSATMETILDLFKKDQPIEVRDRRTVEDILQDARMFGSFTVPVRREAVKLPLHVYNAEERLKEISKGAIEGFAISVVMAVKYRRNMDMGEELEALLWVLGASVWEIARKRKENIYGKIGGESGDHFLTSKEIDAAEVAKEKHKSIYDQAESSLGVRMKRGRDDLQRAPRRFPLYAQPSTFTQPAPFYPQPPPPYNQPNPYYTQQQQFFPREPYGLSNRFTPGYMGFQRPRSAFPTQSRQSPATAAPANTAGAV